MESAGAAGDAGAVERGEELATPKATGAASIQASGSSSEDPLNRCFGDTSPAGIAVSPAMGDTGTTEAIRQLAGEMTAPEEQQTAPVSAFDFEAPSEMTDNVAEEEPELTEMAKLRWEPVNVELIEQALAKDAVRRVRFAHYDVFQILLSLRHRATSIKGKVGWIPVVQRESARIDGKAQRLYSGIKGLADENLPAPVQLELKRGVPRHLAGLSVFEFCRGIKHLVRAGLGFTEYDISNSLFEILGLLVELPPVIVRYKKERKAILQDLAKHLSDASGRVVNPDACKQLILSLGFGGTVYKWMCKNLGGYFPTAGHWGEFLSSFEAAMKLVRQRAKDEFPETFKAVKDRTFPESSLLFVLYAWKERELLGAMMEIAGDYAVSPEHDGFGGKEGLLEKFGSMPVPLAYMPV